jgi:predicted metalloprotease with PDZ domain
MKPLLKLLVIAVLLASGCSSSLVHKGTPNAPAPLIYEVNLNDRADDLFKVKLAVNDLKSENAVYQFAATAPGTYQVMDIGRYVRDFKALDAQGDTLKTERLSTNQWKIHEAERAREIRYSIAETWDTPVDEHRIFPMAGTSLEADHVQINGQAVFGYPTGMQNRPLQIKLTYPQGWLLGTALNRNGDSTFYADNYDKAVDSPFLLGQLTRAELDVKGSKVEIYTYSKSGRIKAEQILTSAKEVLLAAAAFTNGLPVKRYTFLFHFEDGNKGALGAWEHSYSSLYTFNDATYEQMLQQDITGIMAHEFFHIVTPLNIHSEIIEQFNFVEPVPSEHLWLYEATTEWAAQIMKLRGGLITPEQYVQILKLKLTINDQFDKNYSLSRLALTSYAPEVQQQYVNIYHRGAIIVGLLDIRLLELSHGKRGLREVINQLAKTYGPQRAFPEKKFFDIFVAMTHPEIADFFERYVKNAEPLPIAEYYHKLGIQYSAEIHTGKQVASLGLGITVKEGRIALIGVSPEMQKQGLRDGDFLVAYNGKPVKLETIQEIGQELKQLQIGQSYELTIERDQQETTLKLEALSKEQVERHVFELDHNVTEAQLALRKVWMRNL